MTDDTATQAVTATLMIAVILVTIGGNILVVMSVFTYKPLKSVQNFYIVSLACTDLMLAIIVMPFHVINWILGRWTLGHVFCSIWVTCDVLMCTASILNLCVIAIDRYYAIHDPIRYAQKRTLKRVLVSIFVVWMVSALISLPPLVSWFGDDVGHQKDENRKNVSSFNSHLVSFDFNSLSQYNISADCRNVSSECKYLNSTTTPQIYHSRENFNLSIRNVNLSTLVNNSSSILFLTPSSQADFISNSSTRQQRKSLYDSHEMSCQLSDDPSYVLYSASGSFYIPLLIMIFVYVNVYLATKARLRKRAKLGKKLLMTVAPEKPCSKKKNSFAGVKKISHNGKTNEMKHLKIEEDTSRNCSFSLTPCAEETVKETVTKLLKSDNNNLRVRSMSFKYRHENRESFRKSNQSLLPDKPSCETESSVYGQTIQVPSCTKRGQKDSLTSCSTPSLSNEISSTAAEHLHSSSTRPARAESWREKTTTFIICDNDGKPETFQKPEATTGNRAKRPTSLLGIPNEQIGPNSLSKFLKEKQKISLSLERRAARTMVIIMGAFVVCWLPFFVCYVVLPFCPPCETFATAEVVSFFVWLGYINSAINPFIYTIFNIDFRRAFKNILQGKLHTGQ